MHNMTATAANSAVDITATVFSELNGIITVKILINQATPTRLRKYFTYGL